MSEKLEYLTIRLQLSLHLEIDLCTHHGKLLVHLVRLQITTDLDEFTACLVDLATSDQLPRRVGHECCETDEHDDAPGNLDAQRKPPLRCAVRCVRTGVANPVGDHGTKGDAAARDAANEATVLRCGDFAQVDGYGYDHASGGLVSLLSSFTSVDSLRLSPDSVTRQNTTC